MFDLTISSPAAIAAAAALGVVALVLVAGDLGRRARLGPLGRVALAGGIGLGVVSFSIKAAIVLYLSGLEHRDLDRVRNWRMTPIARSRELAMATEAQEPFSQGAAPWIALPGTAPGPVGGGRTAARIALGRALFFDKRLSADGSVSCASCHRLERGGDDDAAVSIGIAGLKGERNAPSVLNAAFLTRLFWDGRAGSLEAQALGPLVNPVEMGMNSLAAVEERVGAIAEYDAAFAAAFANAGPISIARIAAAIAAFERTLITAESPYDRFVRGEDDALTPAQKRGMALFDAIGCRACHRDPTFSSAGAVRPNGTYRMFPVHSGNPLVEKYRLAPDGTAQRWRVPSLRNIAETGPYFHNGAVDDLAEAVRIMAVSQLGKKLSNDRAEAFHVTAGAAEGGRRLTLRRDQAVSDADIADLVAFLKSLSGSLPGVD